MTTHSIIIPTFFAEIKSFIVQMATHRSPKLFQAQQETVMINYDLYLSIE